MSEEIISLFGHVIICEYPKALYEPSESFNVESGIFSNTNSLSLDNSISR